MIGPATKAPGNIPIGVPPSTSSRTFVAPSGPVAVCTTWERRASRLAPSRPSANFEAQVDGRDTVLDGHAAQ